MFRSLPRNTSLRALTLVCCLLSAAVARTPMLHSTIEPQLRTAKLTWSLRRTAWLDAATADAEARCLRDSRQGPLEAGFARLQVSAGPDRLTVTVKGPVSAAAVWWAEARPSSWLKALAQCAAAPPSSTLTPWTPRRLLEAFVAPAPPGPRGFTRVGAAIDYIGPEPPAPLTQLAPDLSPLGAMPPAQPRAAVESPVVRVDASPIDDGLILVAVRAPLDATRALSARLATSAETVSAQWGDDAYVLVGVRARPADLDATWDTLWAALRGARADVAEGAWALVLSPPKALEKVTALSLWAESLRDRAARPRATPSGALERRSGEFIMPDGRALVFAPTPEPTFALRWRWRVPSAFPPDALACLSLALRDEGPAEVTTTFAEGVADVTVTGPAERLDRNLERWRARAADLQRAPCAEQSVTASQAALEALAAVSPPTTFVTGGTSFAQAIAAALTWPADRRGALDPAQRAAPESAATSVAPPAVGTLRVLVHDRSPRALAALELALTALAGDDWVWSQRPRCASDALCFQLAGREAPSVDAIERLRARLAMLSLGPLPPTPFEALRARRTADLDLAWSEPLERLDWLTSQAARPDVSVGRDAMDRWREALDRATSADVQASARALALTP